MLVEVFKANPSDETLMFNILPYISQSLKQIHIKEMKVAAFLTIGQICCRKTLSADYSKAFIRQTLQTMTAQEAEYDEEIKIKGMTVLIFIC